MKPDIKEAMRCELIDATQEASDYLKQNSEDLLLLLDNIPKPGTREFIDAGLLPNKAKSMPYENEEMLQVVKNNLDQMREHVDHLSLLWEVLSAEYEQ